MLLAIALVALDGRDEDEPGEEIPDKDGQKGETDIDLVEMPLLVDEGEGLDEHKDKGIGETGQEGEDKDDGLGKKHLEGSEPSGDDFFRIEAFLETDHLIWAVDVGLDTVLAALLGNLVHHDCRSGFWDSDEVDQLHKPAKDELNPDRPAPIEEFLREAADQGTEDGPADRGEHDEGDSILLVIRLPHIRHHSQGDAATSSREATEGSECHDGAKILRDTDGDLPQIDKEQGSLQNGLAAKLLGPRSPELTPEAIADEEDSRACTSGLLGDAELLGHARDSIAVEGGVEVHRHLDAEDNGENGPLFPRGEAKAELIVAVELVDLDLVILPSLRLGRLYLFFPEIGVGGGAVAGVMAGIAIATLVEGIVGFGHGPFEGRRVVGHGDGGPEIMRRSVAVVVWTAGGGFLWSACPWVPQRMGRRVLVVKESGKESVSVLDEVVACEPFDPWRWSVRSPRNAVEGGSEK